MKKLFIWALVMIGSLAASAQQVKVEYTNQIDSTLSDLQVQDYKMRGIQSFRLSIKGNFDGKRAILKKVSCEKGIFTERPMMNDFSHLIMTDSVETLDFMAMPKGGDSIRIACFYPMCFNTPLFEDVLPINRMKILLETPTPDDGPETTLIAYSTGIPIMDGAATWFCGLRDSGVPPRQWYEKYGIDGYVFYTITLVDDTPPADGASVYQRIAKSGSFATHPDS